MSTTVVQTRLAPKIVKVIDARVEEAGTTRAEVVRELLEAALAEPVPMSPVPAANPLLDRICDELGAVVARIDATLEASRSAARHAAAGHAAAKLGVLMLLPAECQQTYIEKLTSAVQS